MPVGCHAQLGSWQMAFDHGAGSDSEGSQGILFSLGGDLGLNWFHIKHRPPLYYQL